MSCSARHQRKVVASGHLAAAGCSLRRQSPRLIQSRRRETKRKNRAFRCFWAEAQNERLFLCHAEGTRINNRSKPRDNPRTVWFSKFICINMAEEETQIGYINWISLIFFKSSLEGTKYPLKGHFTNFTQKSAHSSRGVLCLLSLTVVGYVLNGTEWSFFFFKYEIIAQMLTQTGDMEVERHGNFTGREGLYTSMV